MISGVRWLALGPGSGYGDASDAYMRGLRRAGVPVSWTPLGSPSPRWGTAFGPLAAPDPDFAHDTVVVAASPLWHEQLAREATGRRLVAYTTWETDRLPRSWVETLNRYERVVVPSRFNRRVFEQSGVSRPIHVVPHIARVPERGERPVPDEDEYVFYSIAVWSARKAIPDLVTAYLSAFDPADPVRLLVHTTPADLTVGARRGTPPAEAELATGTPVALLRAIAGRRAWPPITLSTRHLTRAEIEGMHARGDCFVSLSRGEGWGLGAFDAAVRGRPVIVTGWGGGLDYLPADYPYLVDYELVTTTEDPPDKWWHPRAGERWAHADVAHAARLMREVFEQRDVARTWGRRLEAHTRAKFSDSLVTERLLAALSR